MADPKVKLKRSAVGGRIPSPDQVPLGELALNTWDGQLYASKNVGLGTTVVAINPWVVGTGTDTYNAYFTAGNVGIGLTVPTSTLHVSGDGLFTDSVTVGSAVTMTAGGVVAGLGTINYIDATHLNVSGFSTFNSDVRITDDDKLRFGTSGSGILQIYTNGTNSFFKQTSGDLKYELADQFIVQKDTDDEPIAVFTADGSVELYYDSSKKFETTGAGVTVTGTTFSNQLNVSGVSTFNNDVNLLDNDNLYLGTDQDLRIYHSGTNAVIRNNTGGLFIDNEVDNNDITIRTDDGSGGKTNYIQCDGSRGAVELYHYGTQKFETTSSGVTITGTASATTFSGSGASLTTLNASELDSGTIPDARFPATLPAVSGANLTNLPSSGISTAFTNVQATWSVGGNTSGYTFTGPGQDGAEQNPDIYLVRGQRYRFINGTGSSHPFRIQSDTSGTAYTDGVSGSQNGTQDFNVQHDAPTHLYYQCTIHSGMIGNIYIVGEASGRLGINAHNASTYTLVAGDAGKLVREATNSATITIPQNIFSAGDMISIFNVSGGNNTIAQGTGTTLYNTADGATGNRTLAAKGVCTIVCTSTNEFIISGSGLS